MKFFSILLLILAFNIFGADEFSCGSIECDDFTVNISNNADLQSGLSTYMNYCYGCHSLQYSRYKRVAEDLDIPCLLYTSPSPRDGIGSRMPSSA